MKLSLIDIIACPSCKGKDLRLNKEERDNGYIIDGELTCEDCKSTYYIQNGIPKLLPKSRNNDIDQQGRLYRKWLHSFDYLQRWRRQVKQTNRYKSGEMENYRDKLYKRTLDLIGDINANDPILDVGCGDGSLKRLIENDVNYVGLEPVITDEESYDFELVQGWGEYLPFKNNSIRECFIYETLDHCISPEKLIQEAHRVLRTDGYLNIQQIILQKPTINFSFSLSGNIRSVRNYLSRDIGLKSKTHFFSTGDLIDMIYERFSCIRVYNLDDNHIFIRAPF